MFCGLQTLSALTNFMLAMTLYPDIVSRAQAELDTVTGGERLPTFEDRDQLPLINAILKEVLRWIPVLPLCIKIPPSQD
jgi:cytochrome P450